MSITLDADIQSAMMSRLFGTQDDHYDSEVAAALLRGLRGLDDESARLTIKLLAMDAEYKQIMN